METVRTGLHNLGLHMEYLTYLLEQRSWLAGEDITIADLTAGAHLSCLDYTGDVPWKSWPVVRDWYARIKSRPASDRFWPIRSRACGHRPIMPISIFRADDAGQFRR